MEDRDPKQIRIVYMGTPDFAVAPLKALVESGHNVVAVVTMPDKPAGRGLKVQESAVKKYAVSAGLPVLQPEKLKTDEFVAQFKSLDADLGIVVAFRMLPEIIFTAPKLGTFNLHASLLPQYRGAAPINWAVINGEHFSGVTTFILNKRMDEGEIIDSRRVDISPDDNAGTLHDKLMGVGARLVVDSVELIFQNGFKAKSQPHISEESLKPAPKIFKDTCHIDFSRSGECIINLIRGLSPYPCAWTNMIEIDADEIILRESSVKIFEATFEPSNNAGKVGDALIKCGTIYISCADGYIIPQIIQPAGKQRMKTREYLNGLKLHGGIFFN